MILSIFNHVSAQAQRTTTVITEKCIDVIPGSGACKQRASTEKFIGKEDKKAFKLLGECKGGLGSACKKVADEDDYSHDATFNACNVSEIVAQLGKEDGHPEHIDDHPCPMQTGYDPAGLTRIALESREMKLRKSAVIFLMSINAKDQLQRIAADADNTEVRKEAAAALQGLTASSKAS
jgi:hypothetical protein